MTLRRFNARRVAEACGITFPVQAAPVSISHLAGDVVDIAKRRGRDPMEFAQELIDDARRAA